MSALWPILASLLLGIGSLLIILGTLGLLRLGDIYQRVHAAGIVDTGGAGLTLLGLLVLTDDWMVAVRLILIGMILLLTGPTATHAIARAAHIAGIKPKLKTRPQKTGGKKK